MNNWHLGPSGIGPKKGTTGKGEFSSFWDKISLETEFTFTTVGSSR